MNNPVGMVTKMGRKCGACGEEGHTARNCKTTEEERRLAKLPAPTKIHISLGDGRLCQSEEAAEWPPHWLNDDMAKTLPVCQECQELYKERFNRELELRPVDEV
tara:strand:+ start:2712 stop:3023 length:312 start_codon:yes stop_codon:yes gene_type:complete